MISPGFMHSKPVASKSGWMQCLACPMRTPKFLRLVHSLDSWTGASRTCSPLQTFIKPVTTSRKEVSRELGAFVA